MIDYVGEGSPDDVPKIVPFLPARFVAVVWSVDVARTVDVVRIIPVVKVAAQSFVDAMCCQRTHLCFAGS